MNEMTILRAFACLLPCKEELKDMEESRNEFFNNIPGVGIKGISYSEFLGSPSKNGRLSYISDELDDWDKNRIRFKRYCTITVELCEWLLKQMDDNKRNIFEKRYVEGKTLKEIGEEINHEESYVGKLIRQECIRLKNISM